VQNFVQAEKAVGKPALMKGMKKEDAIRILFLVSAS
jgi:hypothetical protein